MPMVSNFNGDQTIDHAPIHSADGGDRRAVDVVPVTPSPYHFYVKIDGTPYMYTDDVKLFLHCPEEENVFKDLDVIDCTTAATTNNLEQFDCDACRATIHIHTAKQGILPAYNMNGNLLIEKLCNNYHHDDTRNLFKNLFLKSFNQNGFMNIAETYFKMISESNHHITLKTIRGIFYIDLTKTMQSPIVTVIEEFSIIGGLKLNNHGNPLEDKLYTNESTIAVVELELEIDVSKPDHKFTYKRLCIRIVNKELAREIFPELNRRNFEIKKHPESITGLKSKEVQSEIMQLQKPMRLGSRHLMYAAVCAAVVSLMVVAIAAITVGAFSLATGVITCGVVFISASYTACKSWCFTKPSTNHLQSAKKEPDSNRDGGGASPCVPGTGNTLSHSPSPAEEPRSKPISFADQIKDSNNGTSLFPATQICGGPSQSSVLKNNI